MKNRLAKTATGETRASADGFITQEYVDWYDRIARGGVGLIHTGVVYTLLKGKMGPHVPGLDKDDKIPGWRSVADTVHRHGALILAQLQHPGRQMIPVPGVGHEGPTEVVGPSPVRHLVSLIKPRELTRDEIKEVIVSFGEAARRAQEAGLDGVQIHAAHGYLVSSFISRRTNKRTDEYGGSLENRLRVLDEIVKAVREKTAGGFLVTVKLNSMDGLPKGVTLRSLPEIAERVGRMAVDAIELSSGTYEYPRTILGESMVPVVMKEGLGRYLPTPVKIVARTINPLLNAWFRYREGFNMDGIRRIRSVVKQPLICMGGFQTPEVMVSVLEKGEGDIIAMGRQIIADPDFPNKVREGRTDIRWCHYCNTCIALAGWKPAACYYGADYSGVKPPMDGAIRS
ncbi:MAG: NADH:flavin oxidoreductase [Nitrospirae bacterium]|nr:NADH:flavin oxidoreductase [Nitrospirota bacterium]